MWTIFWILITSALILDLTILSKYHHHKISNKKLFCISLMWISLALIFGVIVYCNLGIQEAYEFLTGYLIEYSLSIDNLFIFITIFSFFDIKEHSQQKALTFGIIGAIIMRFIFVLIGIKLIMLFHWLFYVFGLILAYTGIKMLNALLKKLTNNKTCFYENLLSFLKKILPIKSDADTESLVLKHNGKIFFTRTMVAIFAIEICDFIFAIDSIPAIFSITQNKLIIFSSNIFAVIGLRSLFFILHRISTQFAYLKYGIALILIFIGMKMLLIDIYPVPTLSSLLIIISIITLSIITSQIKKRSKIS